MAILGIYVICGVHFLFFEHQKIGDFSIAMAHVYPLAKPGEW